MKIYHLDAEGFEKLDKYNKTEKDNIGSGNTFYQLNSVNSHY